MNGVRLFASRAYLEAENLGLIAGALHLLRIVVLVNCLFVGGLNLLFGTNGFLYAAAALATFMSFKKPRALWAALLLLTLAALTGHGTP